MNLENQQYKKIKTKIKKIKLFIKLVKYKQF
jgi:hypothetical protein